eukprot:jgi/Botrbrau1/19476/Bobra.0338s0093.1
MVLPHTDLPSLHKIDPDGIIIPAVFQGRYKLEIWPEMVRKNRFKSIFDVSFTEPLHMWAQTCDDLLSDTALIDALKDTRADLLIADWANYCARALGEVLQLPHVGLMTGPIVDPLLTSWDLNTGVRLNVPNTISFVPQSGSLLSSPMEEARDSVGKPRGSATGCVAHCQHRLRAGVSTAPSSKCQACWGYVGTPCCPLPPDLEAYMEESGDEGVVYASLGTMGALSLLEYQELAQALSSLPCSVVWKLSPSDLSPESDFELIPIGQNVKVVSWVPQNDLLGHPKLRAYLCHGGMNSVSEAAYHGVPIAGIPLIGDQADNIMKAVARGFGIMVPVEEGGIRAAPVLAALTAVLSNTSFKEAAMKISVRMRARPNTPLQEAADWIEHVIETRGEPYLQTPENYMTLWQLWSLDVAAFLVFVLILSLLMSRMIILWLLNIAKIAIKPRTGEKHTLAAEHRENRDKATYWGKAQEILSVSNNEPLSLLR